MASVDIKLPVSLKSDIQNLVRDTRQNLGYEEADKLLTAASNLLSFSVAHGQAKTDLFNLPADLKREMNTIIGIVTEYAGLHSDVWYQTESLCNYLINYGYRIGQGG